MPAGVTACPGCGLLLPGEDGATHAYLGASAACWSRYNAVLAREYGDRAFWPAHRLSVDAYAAQHPGRSERRTDRSINVHLIGLHLALDRGWPDDRIVDVLRRVAALPGDRLVWRTPPPQPAVLRVDSVSDIVTPLEHIAAVKRWAASVWAAWGTHHTAIRDLANAASTASPCPSARTGPRRAR